MLKIFFDKAILYLLDPQPNPFESRYGSRIRICITTSADPHRCTVHTSTYHPNLIFLFFQIQKLPVTIGTGCPKYSVAVAVIFPSILKTKLGYLYR